MDLIGALKELEHLADRLRRRPPPRAPIGRAVILDYGFDPGRPIWRAQAFDRYSDGWEATSPPIGVLALPEYLAAHAGELVTGGRPSAPLLSMPGPIAYGSAPADRMVRATLVNSRVVTPVVKPLPARLPGRIASPVRRMGYTF